MAKLIWVTDTETTGETPPTAAVCEIAAVPVSLSGEVLVKQHLSSLVQPGHSMPADCQGVHHISDADLKGAPTFESLFKGHFKVLKSSIIAAHNMEFDWRFLSPMIPDAQTICTYKCALRLWPDAPNHKNQTLRYYLKAEPPKALLKGLAPHRALYDAFCTAFILSEALKLAKVDELIRISSEPALLKTCWMKQHKGKPWAEVPADYLRWIIRTGDFSADILHTARFYLDRPTQTA